MNKGQKLLKKAKKIIPGGNQLLSKRSEMFLPSYWPNYYRKAKGCKIWDIENKFYYDFAGMGVTACTLGYSNSYVNKHVVAAVKKGSLTTLNSPEEYEFAKEFLKIHKWADMAKFCKSGGEACMIAIRIARAFSKKDKIAFCGYHGWHDWYLSANLENNKNLDNQLLPELKTDGVSRSFRGSILPFYYNKIETLEKILKKNNIGTIIMEPMRGVYPKNDFLKKVRKLADKHKCILIFDEITSGFHDYFGGIHLKFKVIPDLAIFGKSIANGYPLSTIIGKKNIMNKAQDTFISSTMWTENIGFVAGLATLKYMKKKRVHSKLKIFGKLIKNIWMRIAKENNLKIKISGQQTMPYLAFDYPNNLEISTFFTQEMIKNKFLAGNLVSVTSAYDTKIIKKYEKSCSVVFNKISFYLKNKKKLPLKGSIKHSTFRRLTG